MRTVVLLLFGLTLPTFGSEEAFNPATFYATHCAACHGVDLQGASAGSLIDDTFLYGRLENQHRRNILYGIPGTDMIGWQALLSNREASALVDYIFAKPELAGSTSKPLPPELATEQTALRFEAWISEGLDIPWGLEFTGPNSALVTERQGSLRVITDGQLDPLPVHGLPLTYVHADGGMMDLTLDPDYANNGWIYLGHAHAIGDPTDRNSPAMTRVIRGRIRNHTWVDQEVIFQVTDDLHHASPVRWGCRFIWDSAGNLIFTIGDRNRAEESQDPGKPSGKIYRIRPDGSIPPDNPFIDVTGALPQVYTLGNRNAQGLSYHPLTGELWASEHGPMGGDELNVIVSGTNYGWPIATFGRGYDNSTVSTQTTAPHVRAPIHQWTPSVAICPILFYTGSAIPDWHGDLLLGSLAMEGLYRFETEGQTITHQEIILRNHGRVRDLKTGPDGALYVVFNSPDRIVRVTAPSADLVQ
jgi:aldose sugar dehydrogenase